MKATEAEESGVARRRPARRPGCGRPRRRRTSLLDSPGPPCSHASVRPMFRRLSLALLVLAAALLPGAAAAQAKQTLRLRFPRVDIPAGTSIEACVLIRVPTSTPFDLATWEIRNHGPKVGLGVLHFLVYIYSG